MAMTLRDSAGSRNGRWSGLLCSLAVVCLCAADSRAQGKSEVERPDVRYLDNGVVRVGVDLELGGAITYLADSKERVNLVNNFDWGRQIQMSFYSGPKPFEPKGKKPRREWAHLGWNPIQAGDCYAHRSKILEHRTRGGVMYTRCTPMQWPLENEPGECTFETWIELSGNTVEVRSRLKNARSDKTQYAARDQEVPAIYTNGPFHRLVTYTGDSPFTGDAVTEIPKKTVRPGEFPWSRWRATENWAALVRDDDWGVGVWTPETCHYIGGFSGKPGQGGTRDVPTGYMSPLQIEVLDHDITYEYRYVLILGDLDAIREYVYEKAIKRAPPRYVFKQDRQHWFFRNATDKGWPIKGELHVDLAGDDPHLIGPARCWRAEDAPKIFIHAACRSRKPQARVFWKTLGDADFTEQKSLPLLLRGTGRYRRYDLDLSSSPHYKGLITGLRFDPVPSGRQGDYLKLRSISLRKRR